MFFCSEVFPDNIKLRTKPHNQMNLNKKKSKNEPQNKSRLLQHKSDSLVFYTPTLLLPLFLLLLLFAHPLSSVPTLSISSVMLYPPTKAFPEVGGNNPVNIEIVVVFPAPFSPRRPKILFFLTRRQRCFTATFGGDDEVVGHQEDSVDWNSFRRSESTRGSS